MSEYSIHNLHQAVLQASLVYFNGKFADIRSGVINVEDGLENDMERIRQVQQERGGTEKINTETLPYLVMSLTDIDRDIMIKAPRKGTYSYKNPVEKETQPLSTGVGLFRLIKELWSVRVYFETQADSLSFLESMMLHEETNFAFWYKLPWIQEPIHANMSWDDVQLKKNSKIHDKGLVYSVNFRMYVRGTLFSPPEQVKLVQSVNTSVYLTSFTVGVDDSILIIGAGH